MLYTIYTLCYHTILYYATLYPEDEGWESEGVLEAFFAMEARKGGRYGWKLSSSSNTSYFPSYFPPYPLTYPLTLPLPSFLVGPLTFPLAFPPPLGGAQAAARGGARVRHGPGQD